MAAAPNPFDELQKRKAEEARKEPESKRDAKTELALARFLARVVKNILNLSQLLLIRLGMEFQT